MSFSDWITMISILLAVLLAIFKYDEWEIIKLKSFKKYIKLPLLFLFLSGSAAYFQTNSHPQWLDFLWINCCFQSGFWAIIWVFLFFVFSYIGWKKFTNASPSHDLIKKYDDYLDLYEPSKFSSLFRKYERYFFNSKDKDAWGQYELILTNKKWWLISPNHFKEILFENPDRFHDMNSDVLKSLLFSQLSSIPNSQLAKELEAQENGVKLSEDTPILNIFLSSSNYIEESLDKNILLSPIRENAEEYFTSLQFNKKDKDVFILKPSENANKQVAPKSLIPFYFIQIIDCYWHQVFIIKKGVKGFNFYSIWTEKILGAAPEIVNNENSEPLPNLYLCAVDRMLSNIHKWIGCLKSNNYSEPKWKDAAKHFTNLKYRILCEINNYINKVPKQWLVTEIKHFFGEMITCKNIFNNNFDPDFDDCNINADFIEQAFNELTNEDYYSESEQQDSGYKWLKSKVDKLR